MRQLTKLNLSPELCLSIIPRQSKAKQGKANQGKSDSLILNFSELNWDYTEPWAELTLNKLNQPNSTHPTQSNPPNPIHQTQPIQPTELT